MSVASRAEAVRNMGGLGWWSWLLAGVRDHGVQRQLLRLQLFPPRPARLRQERELHQAKLPAVRSAHARLPLRRSDRGEGRPGARGLGGAAQWPLLEQVVGTSRRPETH